MSITLSNPNEARRRETAKASILSLLRAAGDTGQTNEELNHVSFRYGGRIHELRREGYDIESVHVGEGLWRFVLYEPARPKPGQPGYLAAQPVVGSMTGRAIPAPAIPDSDTPAATGTLFDL